MKILRNELKSELNIRTEKDFPIKGIEFIDINPLIMDKTTFTSFNFDYIKKIKELKPKARVGWLLGEVTDENIKKLLSIGGEEMAPCAEHISEELIIKLRNLNLGVRAWGVTSVQVMKKMCDLNVDGMTVNFPDRLFEYLNK